MKRRFLAVGLLIAWAGTGPASAQFPGEPQDSLRLESPYATFPRTGNQHLELDRDWELAYLDAPVARPGALASVDRWIHVAEPTSVQLALHRTGYGPHPYEHLASERYSWVDEKVWYYRKTFDVPASMRSENLVLVFDGLDYYARVWLNGRLLGAHEGMFGGPAVEVRDLVRFDGENELVVELRSANWGRKADFSIRSPEESAIKPWYLAAAGGIQMFFPLGMWKGARLEALPRVHLERPFLHTARLDGTTAVLARSVELLADTSSTQLTLHPWGNVQLANHSNLAAAPRHEPVAGDFRLRMELLRDGAVELRDERPVTPRRGRVWVEDTVRVENAKLWWPNGLGPQNVYTARMTLLLNGREVDRVEFDHGIRTLEYRRSAGPRTDDRWNDWQFVANGRPFFAKGINWMPADMLYDLPREKYRWLLETMKDAGIQLVRIWGGGILETDEFYDEADRLGILVFQDFPIGNRDTPNLDQRVWEAQVVRNIFRLRNRPSLAIWNGGNEFNAYSYGNAATIGILERNLEIFDPTRPFLRTSPDEGGIHLYPDMDPTWYGKRFSLTPFVEETGIHSMSDAAGIREVVAGEELERLGKNMFEQSFAASHPDFIHHFAEYSPSRVPRMLSRASHVIDVTGVPLEAMVEATQVGAGEFYQVMAESFLANYPVTTGLLPWVFKRPWPVVAAIHLLDGFGQPSAPYYFLKRAYEPTHVLLELPRLLFAPGDTLPLRARVVHAPAQPGAATVTVRVMDDDFRVVHEASGAVRMAAGPSVSDLDLGLYVVPAGYRDRFLFAVVEARDAGGALVSRSVYWPRSLSRMEDPAYRAAYLEEPVEWPLLDDGPWLKPAVQRDGTRLDAALRGCEAAPDNETVCRVFIANRGSRPAFMTQLDVTGAKRLFRADDNFFWLAPGEERELEVVIRWREGEPRRPQVAVWAWNAERRALRVPSGGVSVRP